MNRIYLDNNATSPLLPEVIDAMLPYWTGEFGNPSSLHREGRLARRTLESARETIAELLDAAPKQVIFTSGGTEANNLAILGLAGPTPSHLVTSPIEHPSVLGCFDLLEKRGFQLDRIPVDRSGLVCPDDFSCLLQPDTRLVSLMLVNNETGAIQPVGDLAQEARRQAISFHTDAVQAVGRIPVSFRNLGVNSLSLSAHKFHGPVGVGALLVDQKDLLKLVLTGGHQEAGLRPGTEPIALVVGMAKALELAIQNLAPDSERICQLRNSLEEGLRSRIGDIRLNGPVQERVPNTLNLLFPELDARGAIIALDLLGLACSTGSACASGAAGPSPALLAMGLTEEQARASLRFSLSQLTSQRDITQAIELIAKVVTQWQSSHTTLAL